MTQTNEFSVPVSASRIGAAEGFAVSFNADDKAREALARRYGILSVEALSGEATLRREADGMTISVTGHFAARVTQACVTTMEPVPDEVQQTFEGWFLDESQATSFQRAKKRKVEVEVGDIPFEDDESPIPDERDDPEPVVGGVVDVGELVAQHLSLALNPYPHSAGALAAGPVGDEASLEKPSPFAALRDWKSK